MFELTELKSIRKKIGMTQSELAKKANVSQSLIAKIERRSLDPTFSKAKKIFDTLDGLSHQHQLKAVDVMARKVISIAPHDTIRTAIKKMKEYEISQLPVIEDEKVLGLVSESTILRAMVDHKNVIRDVMEEAPAAVSRNASLSVLSDLLKFYPLVLVLAQGKIVGAVTKADIIRNYTI